MTFTKDMLIALDEDGKYLKAMTGMSHGPFALAEVFFDDPEYFDEEEEYLDYCDDEDDFDNYNYQEDYPNEDDLDDIG
jgi:hypothetical protein